ncbi:RNA-binding protein [Alphaproteobacteria bacterium KMM 3653]|uniref:RNA-binding protein n=1 Tax=Harenicola maris TaxID=2841044 RepID=A0AAP2G495_9RHOB|nr:RNA-binding protein [Harenicola maris]
MGRGGRHKKRLRVERKCIATGNVLDTAGMLRFVVGPDGTIVPDLGGKLPGRGIWVTAQRDALELAIKKNLFSRSAKQAVKIPDGMLEGLEPALIQRLINTLSLARKAGNAIAGYEKVKGALVAENVAVLVQASDGSERGKSKLRPASWDTGFIGCLTSAELGLSFGRDHVIHAALTSGGLATRAVEDAERLAGLRKMRSVGEVGDHPGKD